MLSCDDTVVIQRQALILNAINEKDGALLCDHLQLRLFGVELMEKKGLKCRHLHEK